MSLPVPTLRIDTSGTAFGSAPTFTDYTSSLVTTGDGGPISITTRRQDELAEVPPATCTFYLENIDGRWTPGHASAPAGWDVGARVNVRETVTAVAYDRFDGYVDSISPTWPGGVQSWNVVQVTCTDVTARLGRAKTLKSMLAQEILLDSPNYLYLLDEEEGSISTADSSPNRLPPGTIESRNGTSQVTFGDPCGLFGQDRAVSFDSVNAGAAMTAANALTRVRLGAGAYPPSSSAFSLELWFRSQLVPTSQQVLYMAANPDGEELYLGSYCKVYVDGNGLGFAVGSPGAGAAVSVSTNAVESLKTLLDGNWHQFFGSLSSDLKTLKIYFDGTLVQTITGGTSIVFSSLLPASLGGAISNGKTGQGLRGSLACVAQFSTELSAARVLAHYQAGLSGLEERSDLRFARIAGYGGITTSGLPTGQATMGPQSIGGKTAIEALRDVARTESSPCYATGAGALTFQARNNRYQKAVGLTLAAADLTPDIALRRDGQGQFNELTVTRAGGASQSYADTAKQNSDGRLDGGSFEVCPSTDADAYQNAAWQVNNHKTPSTRLSSLKVDLITMPDATVTSCLTADISTRVNVTGMLTQAPSSTFDGFIEGWTEQIGAKEWSIEFFTSPVLLEDNVWILEDATYGIIDSTNVIAL